MNKKKSCILYLVRTSQEDAVMLQKSLALVEAHLLPAMQERVDIIFFHEKSFDQQYKAQLKPVKNATFIFVEVEFALPLYPPEIISAIPKLYPHPTHDHPGFSMGYRHMCNFFAGSMYKEPILQNYEYYLRLDTDSFILSKLSYDIFAWMEKSRCEYGYIKEALQDDHPKVTEGLRSETAAWLKENNIPTCTSIDTLPENRMFYTNFELGKVSSFSPGSAYYLFYTFIQNTGNIFIRRWGDAPIKYLGINLFLDPGTVQAVEGFQYQHGGTFDLQGFKKPLALKIWHFLLRNYKFRK